VRRAKLYYLRGRTGKSARIAEKTDGYSGKLTQEAMAKASAAKAAAKGTSSKGKKKKVKVAAAKAASE
jgi:large subunit ribosomal protein L19